VDKEGARNPEGKERSMQQCLVDADELALFASGVFDPGVVALAVAGDAGGGAAVDGPGGGVTGAA
jgi:hypothetical protein